MTRALSAAIAGVLAFVLVGAAAGSARILDDFEDLSKWSVHPADGVSATIAGDAGVHGRGIRLDVRFTRGAGYAVVRRALDLDLPPDYAFRFALRGDMPANNLEFKLVDSSGANVWWYVRRDFVFYRAWSTLTTRRRQIGFAWGPAGGGDLRHVAFLEIAVSTGEGGAGSVWIDDLTLEPLEPDSTAPKPRASASSSQPGHSPENVLDGDRRTGWASAPGDATPWLTLDLGRTREIGGITIDWETGQPPPYRIFLSLDGVEWTVRRIVPRSNGGRDPIYLPESEAHYVRLTASVRPPDQVRVREITVEPYEWSQTPEAFFTAIAAGSPRGSWPRPYSGEQCPWAVVGADGGREEALLSLDGALETGKRGFSIEPFLELDGRFITWADVTAKPHLEDDRLPIPSVRWRLPDASLTITAFAHPDTATPDVFVRYRLRNESPKARLVTFYLAARPFQVNPPWQQVGIPGGVAKVARIARDGNAVRVDGHVGFVSITPPSGFGATSFDAGEIEEHLRAGALPADAAADDSTDFASAAFSYALNLPPRSEREVRLAIPLRRGFGAVSDERAAALDARGGWERTPADVEGLERRCIAAWRAKLDRVRIEGPQPARDALRTLEAQVGWILVNRDGPALQPGSRSYDRSWMRDGSLTSLALLRLGHFDEVRDFIEWFAGFQGEDGRIPCCASARGPDPVPENDSHGEFLGLIADYHRYTGDAALVRRQWPHIARAVAYLDTMRAQRRTAEWRAPDRREFFGLVLPSISHEGYANPVHSYWDDFFAYRGYVSAVYLAGVEGDALAGRRFAAARDTFAADLAASIAATMAKHGIDYVPGSAEHGDFDATSTTVALCPTEAADLLPESAVRRTFERYWESLAARRDGRESWDAFTPYETRAIGTFVRLGWRVRAGQALEFFMQHREPLGWRQWPEVAYRDPRSPRFLGDLPHTWVGSDYARSVLDMICYDRGRDSALVLAAGLPLEWIAGEGLRVRDLRTPYGPLRMALVARSGSVEVNIESGLRVPPGGIVVVPPAPTSFSSVTIDGRAAALTPEGGAIVRRLPARLTFR